MNSKDQTPKEITDFITEMLKTAVEEHPKAFLLIKGTGMFLVPAPERGILEYKTQLVEDITYIEAQKRGANCAAFKFVPSVYKSFPQLSALFENGIGLNCSGFCNFSGGHCDLGCFCTPESNFCR